MPPGESLMSSHHISPPKRMNNLQSNTHKRATHQNQTHRQKKTFYINLCSRHRHHQHHRDF